MKQRKNRHRGIKCLWPISRQLLCVVAAVLSLLCVSCATSHLQVNSVAYQSVVTTKAIDYKNPQIPEEANIFVSYAIDRNGKLAVFVKNLTDEIMVIDQEKSFFINSNGTSTSYFDPTVRQVSSTTFGAASTGATVNLGAIANAFGVGGRVGSLLGGISVGESNTAGSSQTSTTIFTDQKRISLGPRGSGVMSKTFQVNGLGRQALKNLGNGVRMINERNDFKTSPIRFKVCISYAFGEEEDFQKLITDFYVDSSIAVPLVSKGAVNQTMRKVMNLKPDLLSEPWFLMSITNNLPSYSVTNEFFEFNENKNHDTVIQGMLYDYQ